MLEKDRFKNKKKQLKTYARLSGAAIQMAIIISAGVWFGGFLDQKLNLNRNPITITLALISVFFSLFLMIREVKNFK